MAKIKAVGNRGIDFQIKCPACKCVHGFNTSPGGWTFDSNIDKPTISPSLLVKYYRGEEVHKICHSFVREGKIQYLSDCTHELAGQIVDLEDF